MWASCARMPTGRMRTLGFEPSLLNGSQTPCNVSTSSFKVEQIQPRPYTVGVSNE